MCIICKTKNIEDIINNITIDCRNCPLITTIPSKLTKIYQLFCSNCPLLTTIPLKLLNLTYLDCSYCPLLTTIPLKLPNLMTLNCSYCPLLTTIPLLPSIRSITRHNCKWLNNPSNDSYNINISHLLVCQQIVKKYLTIRRIRRIRENIPLLTDLTNIIINYYL